MLAITVDSYTHELVLALVREYLNQTEVKLARVRARWGDQPLSRAGQLRYQTAVGARDRAKRSLAMLEG